MKDGWKHLYGVTDASESLNLSPIKTENQGGKVYAVTYKDLSAVVSNTPFIDFKTMRKDLLVQHLLNHQKIVEGVMDSCSIIPFKFGSLAHTEKEVERILILGYGLFKSLLPWVSERVEFELATTWDRERIFKVLYEEEPEIQLLQKMIESKPERDALFEKIKLGKLVRQSLLKKRLLFKDKILSQLHGCTESQCDHDAIDDLMIINTAFLLKKEMKNEFDRRVQQLDHDFSGEVFFKLIGPLPLYSFKCVEIEWSSGNRIRDALSLLGLEENATAADLKTAYYRKGQCLHPDKIGCHSRVSPEFEKVVEAYRLLKQYYSLHRSLPEEGRILLMEVRTKGSNDGGNT
jgi:hypothetical protein